MVGRYLVLSRVGAGGMGVVYAAYDPELDRKVAIKLLHHRIDVGDQRGPLLREAQALARLSHPNVVTVHDVGTVDGRLWLAMEFVAGETLRAWSPSRRGRWREVLPVFIAAGRGLAAAHDAGVVHRDFKPDNVMVAEHPRGGSAPHRVLVMDFGLALAQGVDAASTDASPPGDRVPPALRVTRVGALVGTPAYMAPEQLAAEPEDARTDQFAFAVTLWEALCGERPFAGDSVIELAGNVLEGAVRPVPRDVAMPRWLRRALLRAMAVDPAARFASMHALLAELERGHARGRARGGVIGVVALGLVIAGVATWQRWDRMRDAARCRAHGERIAELWSDERRTRVHDGLVATELAYAATTTEHALPWLDAWASSWQTTREQTCMHGFAGPEPRWDDDLLARADECLEERWMDFEALLDTLEHADDSTARNAVVAASSLPRVDPCGDRAALGRRPALPAAAFEELGNIRYLLARAGSANLAGRYHDASALAEQAVTSADELGHPALAAEARLAQGVALDSAGDYAGAEQLLLRAYDDGGAIGALQVVADAASQLIFVVGVHGSRHAEARVWGHAAEVAAAAVGEDELRRADRLRRLGTMLDAADAFDEAGPALTSSLAISEAALGPDHPLIVGTLANLSAHARAIGDYAGSQAVLERALAIAEAALGPEHPDVGMLLNNLGNVHASRGDYTRARELFERSLTVRERSLGPDHPDVAASLANLGLVYESLGEYPEAAAALERSLAIRERALGPEHVQVAYALGNLALVRRAQGRHAEARVLFERTLAIREKALGPEHRDVASALNNLAASLRDLGLPEQAAPLYERSLAIREKVLGPDHPDIAGSLNGIADLRRELGELDAAERLYQRALAIREPLLGPHNAALVYPLLGLTEIALTRQRWPEALGYATRATALESVPEHRAPLVHARFLMARALWEVAPSEGRDRERAISLAEQAALDFRDLPDASHELAEIAAWLAAHPRPPRAR